MITEHLKSIRDGKILSEQETTEIVTAILDDKCTASQIGAFLMGLSQRGESAMEITGAARVLRSRAATIKAPEGAVDCCGTGGDHSNSYNISTAVSFVVAGCGVPMAKHGNRAASSQSGAADVLQSLGINLDISSGQSEHILKETGFCFLMAPQYHASLRPLASLRKELGFRTIFNLLGPLANPAGVKRQLIGVFDKGVILPMAEAVKQLGTEKCWIVYGSDGMDEITLNGKTHYAQIENGEITQGELTQDDFGLEPVLPEDIRGGDADYNAQALRNLLNGRKTPYRRIVLANAAAVLLIAGKVKTLKEGVRMAEQSIDNGKAHDVLSHYQSYTQQWGKTA